MNENNNNNNEITNNNDFNDPLGPVITVAGELSDFLLHGHLSIQINSDLARESINWQKNCYDVLPIPVYVEANFVRLDPSRHLMLDFFENNIQNNKNNVGTSGVGEKRTSIHDYNSSPLKFRHSNATAASNALKRHHSFNTTSIRSGFGASQTKSKPSNDATATIHQSISRNSASTSPTDQNYYSVNYPQLFKLIGRRYLLNNGARILLNSYWIESNYDLESYNSQIRDDLLNWFQKILTVTACYNQFGLSQDFSMDFFVVIVVRNQISSIGSMSNIMNNQQQRANKSNTNTFNVSGEQLLNLSNLVNENAGATNISPISSQSNKSSKKGINNNLKNTKLSSQQASSLSQSNISVANSNTMSMKPTYLTHQQLADQIRNDLLVCFQLFRQTHLANGTLDHAGIPADNSIIAAQLLERIIIFDSTSNSSQNNDCNSNTTTSNQNILSSTSNINTSSNSSNSSQPTNPIISSTARTFSALSNFSASSIKINPSSMMSSMSPTRNINRTKAATSILSGTPLSSSNSSLVTMPTTAILNYSQFIMRIRHFLLEFHSKQFECYEKLIRLIRDLRNEPQWDYFGFFLLQEELAFAYESLGLYDKALIQYDELDALFSQLIRDASHHSGFSAPMWLRKRLMPYNNQDDDDSDFDNINYDDHNIDNRMKKVDSDIKKSNNYHPTHQNHHGWTGLCLCNQKSSLMLRMSLLQSILVDYNNHNQKNDQIQSKINDSIEQKVNNNSRNRTISENIDDCYHPLSINNNNNVPCNYSHRISLLDFRNYLYSRQCHLLCLLNKPWELASRALPFLQTAVAELNMLEISMPPGGVACWVFLSVLEILHKCERYSDSSQLNSYSYHTVGLWSYARDNLIELGKICKLMPEFSNNNDSSNNFKPVDATEHLHRMIELIAGMGTDPHVKPSLSSTENDNGINDNNWMSPQERLKDALSSSDSFLRHYLEITELTMGTYKHVGHVRCARSIGRQLAELYLKLNKPQQALPFLLDLYNLFQIEHWPLLRKKTLQLLAQCLEQLYFNISNSLNMQNQVSDSSVNSVETDYQTGSSLTLIIRNACRAYLLLLLHEPNENQNFYDNDDCVEHQKIEYLNAMQQIIDHYKVCAQKLKHEDKSITSLIADKSDDSSLLVIHNSYSDLLNLDSGLSSCDGSRSPSNTNQPNSMECDGQVASTLNPSSSNLQPKQISSKSKANSTENLNQQQPAIPLELPTQLKHQRHHSNDQLYPHDTNNIQDQCTIDSNTPINYHYPNYKLMDFIWIENIEISCDQSSSKINSTNRNSSSNNNSQSFIAGSVLKLKLKLHSCLNLNLKLKKIQITLRFHRNDPLGFGLTSQKTYQQTHHNKNIETFPMAQVDGYFSQTHKTSGIKCFNETQILKRSYIGAINSVGSYNRSSSDGQHHKFIISQSSIPISLLNQRLSQDDNYKYFRHLSIPLKFETISHNNETNLNFSNGINEYELQFQTNENLYTIVQQFNLLSNQKPKHTQQKSSDINDLWFNLDQLILFNRFDYNQVDSLTNTIEQKSLNFIIIEDFGQQIPNTIKTMMMNSFRLVKCPPSIELIPLSCHESSSPDVITLKQQQPYLFKNCFIGFPQLMCLNLNSGTSRLPKGLQFFIEIKQLSSDGKNPSIVTTDSSRMVHVSLHKKGDDDNDSLEINNFCLDRSLEPFETYELIVLLRSSYSNKKQLQIKGNKSNQSLIYHPISTNQSVNDKIDQYDFKLSVSWNKPFLEDQNFNESSPIEQSLQTVSCQFTLSDALHVQPKLYTAGPDRKLFQIIIESSKRLPSAFELYFCHPQLKTVENKILSSSSNLITSDYSSFSNDNKLIEPIEVNYSNETDEENQKDNKNCFKYKLLGGGNRLTFTWSIKTELTTCNGFNFNLKFKSVFNLSNDNSGYIRESSEVNIPYEVLIMFDWHTRYIIRQWIEPLIKPNLTIPSSSSQANASYLKNNSETIRVGNPCLLHLKIERHFDNSATVENDVPEEYIMYELICDPQLWLFVSTWNPVSATTLMNNNTTTSNQQQNDSIQNDDGDTAHHQQQDEIDSTPKPIKFGGFKKNQEPEEDNPVTNNSDDSVSSFQTAFEVMPLVAGFIPLPKVRIAKYQSEECDNNDESVQSKLNQESQQQSTKSNNTTIESLSSILAENLSISGKNWSKYLSPNMVRNNQISASSENRPDNSNSASNASSLRNVRLQPFETGQVYNYNRANQIYVLPSIAVSSGSSVNSNVFQSDSSS